MTAPHRSTSSVSPIPGFRGRCGARASAVPFRAIARAHPARLLAPGALLDCRSPPCAPAWLYQVSWYRLYRFLYRLGGASLCPDPGTRAVSSQLVQLVAGATSPGLCAYVLIPGLGAYVPTGGLLSGLVPVRSYDEGRFLSVRRPSRPCRGLRVTSGGSREPSAEDLRRRGRGLLPG